MADQSVLDNTSMSTAIPTNPHEMALQLLCKQLLKSRLFRGFYIERRYVDDVKGYRDIVSLQKSEKSLEKMLRDIRDKLQLFYSQQNPQMWVGITSGILTGITTPQPDALETYLWVEIKDLAFGQYWFSIKSIRFRDNEIILKLKDVQPVEEETTTKWPITTISNKAICDKSTDSQKISTGSSPTTATTAYALENQITFDDFMFLLQQWWASIKQTVYDFMAQDISKENIKGVVRFLGLLIVAILSGALVSVKYLGIFTLRFMFELSRLTQVLTPIIFKIIEVCNRIIGGFYILLAMVWKDVVVNRNQPKHSGLEYNRPMYKSIQYEVKQKRLVSSPSSTTFDKSTQ